MTNFKSIYLLKILHIIHYRLSVDSLSRLGLEYSQIADLLSEVLQSRLVEDYDEEGLKLTNNGLALLDKMNKDLYPSNSQGWILPSDENRTPKIDKFDIYLPRKKQREE